MNKALLDANALIAAFDENHLDHLRAREFLDALKTFYTTPQTEGAFLRFLTRPWTDADGVRQKPRLTTGEAMRQLKEVQGLGEHRFLSDDISFSSVSMRSLSGFKQWNDAYLIALAKHHGLKLATLDKKIENMDDAKDAVLKFIP
jgi:predicted nucleic acid-binding protein